VQIRLLNVIHLAFVHVRNLALKGDCQQVGDLADTFEILPELMTTWDESTLGRIRALLADYESSHPQSGYEYLSMLDGDDTPAEANGFNVIEGGNDTGSSI